MKSRVVITGLGAVSPIGNNTSKMWESVKASRCGIDFITHFNTEQYQVKLAAEVKDLDMFDYLSKQELRKLDRFAQFALIAAKQAYQEANFPDTLNHERMGVILSSGIGGLKTIENSHQKLLERGAGRVSPHFIPMALANLAAGNVAIALNAKGMCSSVITACAASTNAIGDGFRNIRDGYLDIVIAGGTEASITPLGIAGFSAMKAVTESNNPNLASIPFDAKRSGFVMGEGSGVLILESLEHALARKAKIYGEIIGYGTTCDAFHITAPESSGAGAIRAMELALKDGQIAPERIDYINAHGTSTLLNDKTETAAIKAVFKDCIDQLAVSSTKSLTGHLLGASGAIEAIITIKALQEGFIPPTINYVDPDPDCDLDVVPNVGREQKIHYAMSNSFGFGGHNASIILKKWEDSNEIN